MFSYIRLNSSKEYHQNVSFRVVSGRSGLEEIAWEREQITQAMEQNRRFFHLIDWYRCYLDALEEHPEQVFFLSGLFRQSTRSNYSVQEDLAAHSRNQTECVGATASSAFTAE